MNRSTQTMGTLQCRIVDALPPDAKPGLLVALCHGFGAPGDDLVDLGTHLLQSHPELRTSCRFVFPEAPLDLGPLGMPGGRAWWPINMARLAEIHQTQDFSQLTNVCPDGMPEASSALAATVREMQRAWGVDDDTTVLGGFSQGAMVSTDITLRHGFRPALLTLFSGTLLCRDDWTRLAGEHPGCPVFQSHGTADMVLPFGAAELLREMLRNTGFDVSFMDFPGPHTIPMEALTDVGRRIVRQVVSSAPDSSRSDSHR